MKSSRLIALFPFLFYFGCVTPEQISIMRDLDTEDEQSQEGDSDDAYTYDILGGDVCVPDAIATTELYVPLSDTTSTKKDNYTNDTNPDLLQGKDTLDSVAPLDTINELSTIDGKLVNNYPDELSDANDVLADGTLGNDTNVSPEINPIIYLNTIEDCVDYLVNYLNSKGYEAEVCDEGNWKVQIFAPAINDYLDAEAQIRVKLPQEKDGKLSCNFDFYIRCKSSNEGGLNISSDCPNYKEAIVPNQAKEVVDILEEKLMEWLEEM